MAPTYKLTYFDIKGVAETTRFILKHGGIDFEDERIPRDKWTELKPTIEFGQVPLLTIDGKVYNQSMAINRYLAKKANLAGSNDLEALEIESVADTISDLRLKFKEYSTAVDPATKEAKKAAIVSEHIPFYFSRWEKRAKENNGWLAASKLTWVDFYFTNVAEFLIELVNLDLATNYPNLEKVRTNVLSLPAIKEWVAKRPIS